MPSFKDQDARDWELPLDALAILKIREDCDPRFMLGDESEEDNTCLRLEDDPILLCRVLYLLCDKQRADRSVSEADFYLKVLGDGDTIQAAGEAMVATIINFIQPRKRKWIEAVVAKQKAVEDLVIAKALAKMDNPELIADGKSDRHVNGRGDREEFDAVRECLRLAGFCGVNPRGLTLRMLTEMALGKSEFLALTSATPILPYDPKQMQ